MEHSMEYSMEYTYEYRETEKYHNVIGGCWRTSVLRPLTYILMMIVWINSWEDAR